MYDDRRRPPPNEFEPQNEEFVREILAIVCAKSDARTKCSSYGEVVVRFAYENGEIKTARLVEETILRPRPRKR